MGASAKRRRKSVIASPQKGHALNFESISDLQWMQKKGIGPRWCADNYSRSVDELDPLVKKMHRAAQVAIHQRGRPRAANLLVVSHLIRCAEPSLDLHGIHVVLNGGARP